MLGEKMRENEVSVWLVNTGWTGGAYGTGQRIQLSYTRAMICAVLKGELDKLAYMEHAIFGFAVPEMCPGVPADILDPRNTWTDKAAYDRQAKDLARQFTDNFKKYASQTPAEILAAAPKVL